MLLNTNKAHVFSHFDHSSHLHQGYLIFWAELDEQGGFPVPHENESIVGFNYEVVTHSAVTEWRCLFISTWKQPVVSFC